MYNDYRKYSAPGLMITTAATTMATERDRGYAWAVLSASTLIMFLGPSALSAYGNMTGTVVMSDFERIWTVVAMACFMSSAAILIAPLSELTSFRKVALLGCLLAASGFLLTGSAIGSPKWFLLSLSTCVGLGLGLAIHASFLVVSLYFYRFRGLAIGIMSVSVAAGNLLSPVMYDFMTSLKDRLHLRALVVTVGFMAASFYANPPRVSRLNSRGGLDDHGQDEPESNVKAGREAIPLVDYEGPSLHLLNQRRPSKFMEAIAATLPAIIPEESESEDPSKCPSVADDDETMSQITVNSIKSIEHAGLSNGRHVESEHDDAEGQDKTLPVVLRKTGEIINVKLAEKVTNVEHVIERDRSLPLSLHLVGNATFVNMAVLSSLVMIVVPNFPVILYANVTRRMNEEKDNSEADIVMYVMFSMDLVSRLLTSYLSDFAFFNRRLGFLCAATAGAVIISVIGLVEDMHVIYILSAVYGVSSGVLAVTESLMFADKFGMEQFPSVYGLVGLCKALLILIISATFHSPCSSFGYIMDPMLHPKVNDTICTNCDPLGIFTTGSNPHLDEIYQRSLLQLISIPGFLCTVTWSVEYLITFILSRRSSGAQVNCPLQANETPV